MSFTRKIQDDAWDQRFNSTRGECCYCKKEIRINDCHYDHKISVFNGGLDTLENCEPICHKCNLLKGNRNKDEFMKDLYPTEIQKIEKRIEIINKTIDDKNKLHNKEIVELNNQKKLLVENINLIINIPEKIIPIKSDVKEIIINPIKNIEKVENILVIKKHKKSKKPIIGFTFNDKEYQTQIYKDIIKIICDTIASENKDFSQKVLSLSGFTKNKDDLFSPYNIKGTDIFIETNLSSGGVIYCSNRIINMFDYDKEKLKINYKI